MQIQNRFPPPTALHSKRLTDPTPHFGNAGYRLSKWFLHDLNQNVAQAMGRYYTKAAQGNVLHKILKPVWGFIEETTKQDYPTVQKLGSLSLLNSPMGMMSIGLLGFTMGSRVNHAIERAERLPDGKKDMREAWDVVRRDVISMTVLLWGLDILRKQALKALEKLGSITLLHGGQIQSFENLQEAYDVKSPQILRNILKDPRNREGVLLAVQTMDAPTPHLKALRTQFLNDHMKPLVNLVNGVESLLKAETLTGEPWQRFQEVLKHNGMISERRHLETLIKEAQATPSKKAAVKEAIEKLLQQRSEKAFTFLAGDMNGARQAFKEEAAKKADFFSKKFLNGLNHIQDYRQFYSRYAKVSRLPIDIASLGIIIFILGFLPVWFNDQYNQWQYKQHLKKLNTTRHADPQQFNQFLAGIQPPQQPAQPWGRTNPFATP